MIQTPTIDIKGTLNKVFKKSFTNQKEAKIEYYQVCLLTGNEYYPLMYLSCTKEVFDELDGEENTGLDFVFSGKVDQTSVQSDKGNFYPKIKIRIESVKEVG